jgi:hypothetical protein
MNTTDDTKAADRGSELSERLGPLADSEEDPARLWAEIHLLRAELAGGPLGYATWKDAATAERLSRVEFQLDAQRFRWLAERTAATGLERWVHPFQFLAEAVDERMKAGATSCD